MSVWEERWHPLREEWVIVAAHRQNRPWIGEIVTGRVLPQDVLGAERRDGRRILFENDTAIAFLPCFAR